MNDFESWFSAQSYAEADEPVDEFYLECTGCGKHELVSKAAQENGDAWAWDFGDGTGLCGGSDRCVP